jgi:hypothetical protein
MQITHYDIDVGQDGDGSNGSGLITVDRNGRELQHTVAWQTGGRDCEWTVDGEVLDLEPMRAYLDEWTEVFDVVEKRLQNTLYKGEERWHARIKDGKVMWLIVDNWVIEGQLIPS